MSVAVPSSPRVRVNAALALRQILFNDRTIDWVDTHHPAWLVSPQSRAFAHGVLRHYYSLSGIVDAKLDKPLRTKDRDIYCLLLVGAYQLIYGQLQDHAAVNETVEACLELRKPWGRGLVNGVLRGLQREQAVDKFSKETKRSVSTEHNHWLAQRLPRAVLEANNRRAPMTLRINRIRTTVEAYRTRLNTAGIGHQTTPLPEAVVLDRPQSAETLPGWQAGEVAIQDLGAQYANRLLNHYIVAHRTALEAQQRPPRFLDVCAAPGGKLAHFHESLSRLNVEVAHTALESSPNRLALMRAQLDRLGHSPARFELIETDATTLDWWNAVPFDLILLDAPCSGTGTIRRHPEIKIHMTPEAVAAHVELQRRLLDTAWSTLAKGGTLLYSTCSILDDENDAVIEAFLATRNDASTQATVLATELPSGAATRHGWQLLPTDPHTDGFYYALLHKRR